MMIRQRGSWVLGLIEVSGGHAAREKGVNKSAAPSAK